MHRLCCALIVCAVAALAGDALAMGGGGAGRSSAKSGVETLVWTLRGGGETGIEEGKQFKISQPPANGSARIAVATLSTGTGKKIRVAQVFYKSKPGFVGTDSFSYQSVNRTGAVQNFTLSVNVR